MQEITLYSENAMAETGKLDLSAITLRQAEVQALKTFVRRLHQAFPDQILQVSLFGSKARGESDADSDVDVLVIINQHDRPLRREIIDIASDLSLEYDVLSVPGLSACNTGKTGKNLDSIRTSHAMLYRFQ